MSARLPIEPVQRSRLSQQVIVQLCQLIQSGRIEPGDRLPSERDLAEQLAVSRPCLREALRALELSGLIESRHGGGTYVRDFGEPGVFSPLVLMLGMTEDLAGDLGEVRKIFEPSVAMRAAMRADEEDLVALRNVLARQAEVLDSGGPLYELLPLDREFHAIVARASHNQVAMRMVQLINQLVHEGLGRVLGLADTQFAGTSTPLRDRRGRREPRSAASACRHAAAPARGRGSDRPRAHRDVTDAAQCTW